jgi:uncharacterized protein
MRRALPGNEETAQMRHLTETAEAASSAGLVLSQPAHEAPRYLKSKHVVVTEYGEDPIVYHAMAGKAFRGGQGVLKIIDVFDEPRCVDEVASRLGMAVADVSKVVENLVSRHMLVEVLDGVPNELQSTDPSMTSYHLKLLRLYVTKTCNMACTYCFEPEHNGPRMDLGTCVSALKAYRKWLDEAPDNGCELIKINFFGGEPLVCKDLLRDAIPYVHDAMKGLSTEYRITINSNGTLITPEIAQWMVSNRIQVYTSIDGLKETNDEQRVFRGGRGSFDAAIRGLRYLIEAADPLYKEQYLTILCTVSPKNLKDVEALSHYLFDIGIRNLAYNAAFSCAAHSGVFDWTHWTSLSKEEMSDFVLRVTQLQNDLLKKGFHIGGMWAYVPQRLKQGGTVFCQAVGNEIGVSAKGKLYPCPTTLDNPDACIGELGEDDTFKFNHISYKWKNRSNDHIGKCTSCSIKGICRGGCPASSLLNGYDIYDPQQCEYWFAIVDAYLKAANQQHAH